MNHLYVTEVCYIHRVHHLGGVTGKVGNVLENFTMPRWSSCNNVMSLELSLFKPQFELSAGPSFNITAGRYWQLVLHYLHCYCVVITTLYSACLLWVSLAFYGSLHHCLYYNCGLGDYIITGDKCLVTWLSCSSDVGSIRTSQEQYTQLRFSLPRYGENQAWAPIYKRSYDYVTIIFMLR